MQHLLRLPVGALTAVVGVMLLSGQFRARVARIAVATRCVLPEARVAWPVRDDRATGLRTAAPGRGMCGSLSAVILPPFCCG